MKIEDLEKKLWQAARALPTNDHVPCGFEKSIMARLFRTPPVDIWTAWSRLLWRAAAPCVGVVLVLSAWTIYSGANTSSDAIAADFERTVWGPLSSLDDSW